MRLKKGWLKWVLMQYDLFPYQAPLPTTSADGSNDSYLRRCVNGESRILCHRMGGWGRVRVLLFRATEERQGFNMV